MEEIYLNDILHIPKEKMQEYKIRLLVKDPDQEEPLDQIIENDNKIIEWTAWKQESKYDLSRKYVISLVRIYTQSKDYWLYLGTYKVERRNEYKHKAGVGYDLMPVLEDKRYFKRLIIEYKIGKGEQNTKLYAEKIIDDIKLLKIMSKEELEDFRSTKRM